MKKFVYKVLIFSFIGFFIYLLIIAFLGYFLSPNFGVKYIRGSSGHILTRLSEVKKAKNVAVLQNKRWNEILERMVKEGEQRGLSEEFIVQFFKAIHQESISHQEKVFKNE